MGTMQKKMMKNDENGQLSYGIYSSPTPAAARFPLQGWVGDRCRDRSIYFRRLKKKIVSEKIKSRAIGSTQI